MCFVFACSVEHSLEPYLAVGTAQSSLLGHCPAIGALWQGRCGSGLNLLYVEHRWSRGQNKKLVFLITMVVVLHGGTDFHWLVRLPWIQLVFKRLPLPVSELLFFFIATRSSLVLCTALMSPQRTKQFSTVCSLSVYIYIYIYIYMYCIYIQYMSIKLHVPIPFNGRPISISLPFSSVQDTF